ncbi:outer membrane beta-barrel protein [Lacinutrix salivirga]
MKQLIFTLALLVTLSNYAQESFSAKTEGSFLANGTIGIIHTNEKVKFDGNTNDVGSTFQITATPKAGYFIKNNLAIGLELEVRTSSSKIEGFDEKTTTSGIAIGPFARYYFDNNLFAEALVGVGSNKTSTSFGDLKSNILAFRATAGYAFFIGDHIAIEPAINYTYQSQKPKDSEGDAKTILGTVFFSVGFTAFF